MDERKRERMMKVFRIVALVLAVAMIAGVIIDALV